jgi:hypothetical protein
MAGVSARFQEVCVGRFRLRSLRAGHLAGLAICGHLPLKVHPVARPPLGSRTLTDFDRGHGG